MSLGLTYHVGEQEVLARKYYEDEYGNRLTLWFAVRQFGHPHLLHQRTSTESQLVDASPSFAAAFSSKCS